ncbi:nucleoplasmin-like [Candoia aspera]|uniref:nucleoplasmin-like n=1 Tax=Candoia aspera TaxID=51853 RepID=UPI002FD86CE2
MALEASSATIESFCSEKPVCVIWGCQLNRESRIYTFDTPEEWSCEQQLALRTICLGENAKDEFNVVEILPPKSSTNSTPVRIATLKLSVLPMATLAGLDLTPPITFRLKSGSGPVYLAGQHVTVGLHWNGDDDQEGGSSSSSQQNDETESSSKEDSPVKPVKFPPSKRVSAAKKDQEPPVQEPTLCLEAAGGQGCRTKPPEASRQLLLGVPVFHRAAHTRRRREEDGGEGGQTRGGRRPPVLRPAAPLPSRAAGPRLGRSPPLPGSALERDRRPRKPHEDPVTLEQRLNFA